MIASSVDALLNIGRAKPPSGTQLLATARGTLRVRDTGAPRRSGQGAAPVVVIVPDGPNVIEHHTDVIDRLAPHARVICFDMPGFGWSRPRASYDHTLAQGSATVLGAMDALNVREASLLFSCANGFYAIAAAKAAPTRIRSLLLCQTPSIEAMPAWTARNVPKPLRTPVVGQVLMRTVRRKLAHTWYGMSMPDKPARTEFRAVADHALTHGACFCLAGVVQGLSRGTEAELAGVKQPVTLLWGDADRSHKHTRAESLLNLLPHARIMHFPECGHFPDLEEPRRYAEIALAALDA